MVEKETDGLPELAHGLEYFPGTETQLALPQDEKDLKYWRDRAIAMEGNYDTYKSIFKFTEKWMGKNHPDVYTDLSEAFADQHGYPL